MKKFKSIFFFLLLSMLIGCEKDRNETVLKNKMTNSEINGMWTIVNVSGGFAGVNEDFQSGLIIWKFDESTKMLTVENANQNPNTIHDGLQTGVYTYSSVLTTTSCGVGFYPLSILDNFESCYTITDNILTIKNNQIADGFEYKLVRMLICGNN